MNLVKTKAIVIRSIPYGESDLVVIFFSPAEGIIRGMAKGARKSRKRFQGSLEPFATVMLGAAIKESGALARVDAADLVNARLGIREDLKKYGAGSVMLELVSIFEVAGAHSGDAFSLLETALDVLEMSSSPLSLLAAFFPGYLRLSGFAIPLSSCGRCGADLAITGAMYAGGFSICCPGCAPFCAACPPEAGLQVADLPAAISRGTVAFLRKAEAIGAEAIGRLKLGGKDEKDALDFLGRFAASAAGKRLKTLDIASEF